MVAGQEQGGKVGEAALCPLCGARPDGGLTVERSSMNGEGTVPLTFLSCPSCGLHFQEASPEEDGSLYERVEVAGETQGRKEGPLLYLDADVLEELRRVAPGNRLLDVGSGDGRFLRAALKAGFQAEGVDVSPEMAAVARERSGAKVHEGLLSRLRLPAHSFDVINLDLVLMYVPDPVQLMAEVRRLLAPGGICRVREMILDSLAARLKGSRWWFYRRTTLRAYSHQAILELAERAGLRLMRWYTGTEVGYGTWRRHVARHKGRLGLTPFSFAFKKLRWGTVSVTADRTYYLQAEGPDGRLAVPGER